MIHLLGMAMCAGGFLTVGLGEAAGWRYVRHAGLGIFGAGLAVLLFAMTGHAM